MISVKKGSHEVGGRKGHTWGREREALCKRVDFRRGAGTRARKRRAKKNQEGGAYAEEVGCSTTSGDVIRRTEDGHKGDSVMATDERDH